MTWLFALLGIHSPEDVAGVENISWMVTNEPEQWMLMTIIGLGVLAAAVNLLPGLVMRRWVRGVSILLRLAMLGLLLMLLMGVSMRVVYEAEVPQRWLMLVDDSASMNVKDDAAGNEGSTRYQDALEMAAALREGLASNIQLTIEPLSGEKRTAGDESGLAPEAGQGTTPLRSRLNDVLHRAHPWDRLILLSDGRDSDDASLEGVGRRLLAGNTPVDVHVLGQEIDRKDFGIFLTPAAGVVRLGEPVVLRGSITGGTEGQGLQAATIRLKYNGKPVEDAVIQPHEFSGFTLQHQPEKAGSGVYELEMLQSDASDLNNSARAMVQIVDRKIRVLMLESFPGYEFKILKTILEVDPLVELVTVSHLPGGGVYVQGEALHSSPEQGLIDTATELFKYDVILLRDLSRKYFRPGGDMSETRLRHIADFVTRRGGGLIVTGGKNVYRAGAYGDSALAPLLPFDLSDHYGRDPHFKRKFYVNVPPSAVRHPILQLRDTPTANASMLNSLPQLEYANNVGRFRPAAVPLMTRTVELPIPGSTEMLETEIPVMAYMPVGEGKVIGVTVDTLWRWQLQNTFDDPPLRTLLANMIRYVAPPAKSPLNPKVTLSTAAPRIGERVTLTSELRNLSYEPVRNAELEIQIHQPDGTVRRMLPRDLPEEPGVYRYDFMVQQAGEHRVEATHEDEKGVETFFYAGYAAGEFATLSADPDRAAALAQASGGILFTDADAYLDGVDQSPNRVTATQLVPLWNSWAIMILFITLVSLDCYLRKREGLV